MRKTMLVAAGLAVSLAAPSSAAVGSSGPFTGAVLDGDTRIHRYDNNPLRTPCIQIFATYRVTLSYQPTADTLTLSVGGASTDGHAGRAELVFESRWCTAFDVRVTGTAVTAAAAYTVSVTKN